MLEGGSDVHKELQNKPEQSESILDKVENAVEKGVEIFSRVKDIGGKIAGVLGL